MDPVLFFTLPFLVAIGSASVSYYVMRCKQEVALAREQASLAAAQARIEALEQAMPERLRLVEERAHRQALESFLRDFRVEERRLVRDTRTHRPVAVLQERLFFRDVPLSNWVEQEVDLRDGMDLHEFDRVRVFCTEALGSYGSPGRPAHAAGTPQLLLN